jgi:hypothetical protein
MVANPFHTYMDQAPDTVLVWLQRGVKEIDNLLGEGYAKKHPELLGAFVNACALDQFAMHVGGSVVDKLDNLSGSIRQISDVLFETRIKG